MKFKTVEELFIMFENIKMILKLMDSEFLKEYNYHKFCGYNIVKKTIIRPMSMLNMYIEKSNNQDSKNSTKEIKSGEFRIMLYQHNVDISYMIVTIRGLDDFITRHNKKIKRKPVPALDISETLSDLLLDHDMLLMTEIHEIRECYRLMFEIKQNPFIEKMITNGIQI